MTIRCRHCALRFQETRQSQVVYWIESFPLELPARRHWAVRRGNTSSTSYAVALLFAQRLCRVDSSDAQSWHGSSNQCYQCEHGNHGNDCGQIVDANAIEHAV